MPAGAYEKMEGSKARKFIERLNKAWSGSPFEEARTVVHARSLSFAKGWVLAEASDAMAMPEKKCVALDDGKTCMPIEYGPDFIPKFASNQNLYLSHETATDYLRFWFEYARSGTERFVLVENLEDIPWREEPTPQARKSLTKSIIPLTLVSPSDRGFLFKATLLFRDTLMASTLEVESTGRVALKDKSVIAESLTVTDSLTGF